MKKKLFFTFVVALAMAIPLASFSQSGLLFHFGPSFPLADYGDDDMNDVHSGLAGVGINVGGKYVYSLNQSGLGLYVGADFMINGYKSSVRSDIEDEAGSGTDITFPKYINIPVTAGLNYTLRANEQVSFFGDLGIGASFLQLTNAVYQSNNYESTIKYKLSTNFGFNVGGGLLINDKFTVGLHYYGLGEHRIKGEIKSGTDTEDLDTQKLNVSLLTLTVGVRL